jgi:NO-binding membrane sensor protein with MHYT domain
MHRYVNLIDAGATGVHLDHFSYGWLTPTLAYILSFVGSLLGLVCTVRARYTSRTAARAGWLILAAWAIGGTGIWVMHFMAMIGFSVPGVQVRYDVPMTIASWIAAFAVVSVGLFLVGFGRPSRLKVLAAGIFTGVGVAAMHYIGMAAMRVQASVTYDGPTVAISVGIAIVAATVALWFTVTLRRASVITVAALIMGLAVTGMHYTGMYALRISSPTGGHATGVAPMWFLGPIVLAVASGYLVLFGALLSRSGADGHDPTMGLVPQPVAVSKDYHVPLSSASRRSRPEPKIPMIYPRAAEVRQNALDTH